MRKVKPVETEITPSSRSSRKVLISKFQKKSRLRSSHQRYSVRKGVLRSFRKFTWGLQLYQKRLWRKCFPVNFVKFLRTSFSQNTFWRLLLPFFVKYKNAYFEKLRLRHMRRAIVRAQPLQLHIGPNLDITKTLAKKKKNTVLNFIAYSTQVKGLVFSLKVSYKWLKIQLKQLNAWLFSFLWRSFFTTFFLLIDVPY